MRCCFLVVTFAISLVLLATAHHGKRVSSSDYYLYTEKEENAKRLATPENSFDSTDASTNSHVEGKAIP